MTNRNDQETVWDVAPISSPSGYYEAYNEILANIAARRGVSVASLEAEAQEGMAGDATIGIQAYWATACYMHERVCGNVSFLLDRKDLMQKVSEEKAKCPNGRQYNLANFKPPFDFVAFWMAQPLHLPSLKFHMTGWIFGHTKEMKLQAPHFIVAPFGLTELDGGGFDAITYPQLLMQDGSDWAAAIHFHQPFNGALHVDLLNWSLMLCEGIIKRNRKVEKILRQLPKPNRHKNGQGLKERKAQRPVIISGIFGEPKMTYCYPESASSEPSEAKVVPEAPNSRDEHHWWSSHVQLYWIRPENAEARVKDWADKGREAVVVWEHRRGELVAMLLQKEAKNPVSSDPKLRILK